MHVLNILLVYLKVRRCGQSGQTVNKFSIFFKIFSAIWKSKTTIASKSKYNFIDHQNLIRQYKTDRHLSAKRAKT